MSNFNPPANQSPVSGTESTSTNLETTEGVRQPIVLDAIDLEATEQVPQTDDDRSPGLDQDPATPYRVTTPIETPVIRDLIVLTAQDTVQTDDDRSPGLDRDIPISGLTPDLSTAAKTKELAGSEATQATDKASLPD